LYRLIHTKIDQDDWYLSLDAMDKCIYLNLIISSATNSLGVINNSQRYLSYTIGISKEELEERLEHLREKVLFLKEYNIIYIKNFVKYQAGSKKNGNFLKSVKKALDNLPPEVIQKIIEFDASLKEFIDIKVGENDKNKANLDAKVGNSETPFEGVQEFEKTADPLRGGREGVHTVSVSETVSETETVSVSKNKESDFLNFLKSNEEEEIAEILARNSGGIVDSALVDKVKEHIPRPQDRKEVARVLKDICSCGMWQRKITSLESLQRYWGDIQHIFGAKPIEFKGGGDCSMNVEPFDSRSLFKKLVEMKRLE
jgi:hypothetical protein